MLIRRAVLPSATLAALLVLLSACAAGMLPEFGGTSCRTVYVLSGPVVRPVNTCGGVPREGLVARNVMGSAGGDLAALLAAPKFEPDMYYSGVDAPEDRTRLTAAVNGAIKDVVAMPAPRQEAPVRQRLAKVLADVAGFTTEDREHAYVYVVLAWKAAGFTTESGVFPVSDLQILTVP